MNESEDRLERAFSSDIEFQSLLGDVLFIDYFNTFLSLPIFAKRLLYHQDKGVFEIEPPVSRTAHHLLNERVVTWVRRCRGELFLKTLICNEYQLCAKLVTMPLNSKIEPYSIEETNALKIRYLKKVIDMQRMKLYLSSTVGENLMLFWLDAQMFNKQIEGRRRRFFLKEIQEKYLNSTSPNKLNDLLKESINKYLKERLQSSSASQLEQGIPKDLLAFPQQMVLESFHNYWIPKYLHHRTRRRAAIAQKWGQLVQRKSIIKNALELESEKVKTEEGKMNNVIQALHVVMTKRNEDLKNICLKASLSRRNSITQNSTTNLSRKNSKSKTVSVHSSQKSLKNLDQLSSVCSSSSSSDYGESGTTGSSRKEIVEDLIDKLTVRKQRKVKRKKRKQKSRSSNDEMNDVTRDNKIHVSIRGSPADENRGTTKEVQQTRNERLSNDNEKKIQLPPLTEPYANQTSNLSRKKTLLEAVYLERDYEADTEDDDRLLWEQESDWELKRLQSKRSSSNSYSDINLPMIINVAKTSKSVVVPLIKGEHSMMRKLETPFNKMFMQKNKLAIFPDRGRQFQLLLAALTTDPIAGNPLARFLEKTENKCAENNLKFWVTANGFLTNQISDQPMTRHRHYRALINLYLDDTAERKVSLTRSFRQELCELLLKDLGITKLMEACDLTAEALLPDWLEFLRNDEEVFVKQTTKQKSQSRKGRATYDHFYLLTPPNESDDEKQSNATFFEAKKKTFTTARLWRAMELAISICKQKPEILPDTEENDKWTTDEDNEEENDEGSLNNRSLDLMKKKAEKSNHEKLKGLFKNPYGIGLVHDYRGTSALFSKQFTEDAGNNDDFANLLTPNEQKSRKISTQRPPRPRCFQDILVDPIQFDFFKRFLQSKKEDIPLTFWSAVESMRTATKSAKARQGRAHGIVKRYFGISTNYGKDLKCDADVIKEIPHLEKVTPAMLMSAQACVAKSMEEAWFAKYLQTYEDDGGTIGVTLLPIYGRSDQVRSVKQKTRGLWRMFTRNVISFRRGIMNPDTLTLFRKFLVLQHQLNLNQFQSSNDASLGGVVPRIVVNNKLIYTDKLVSDLSFWTEVERYKDFADAVVLCAKLGNYTKDDELIVVNKAKTIVDCFIESQITPRIQINISNELAENVIHLVNNGIIERGLFHEAALSTFSTLIYFWKKFCLYRFLPQEVVPSSINQAKNNRSVIIRQKETLLKNHKMKKVSLPPDEDCPKIMFSLQMGLRLALQRQGGRRRRVEQISPQLGKPPSRSPAKTPVH